ncbi:MAG: 23S rRNA (uracil(1939)-C(5))-methyltransferase RlmD [bacterium]
MSDPAAKHPVQKGTVVTLEISSLAFGGRGVARENGYIIFVDGALPGQQVRARILRKRKAYAEARAVEILRPSPEEIQPRCRHFGECGGCRFQNLAYAAQMKHKRKQVIESLEHVGGFRKPPVLETIGSPEPFYYRNKMEFSFGRRRWLSAEEVNKDEICKRRDFALGLHVRGRFDKILDLDECYLQSPLSVEILHFVRAFVVESAFKPYTTLDHSGFWRHLVVRTGTNTNELLINIVTADVGPAAAEVEQLAQKLTEDFPQITTVVHNINRRRAEVAISEEERVLFGPGHIQERIGEHLFQISANSFFQTNTKGAELLYAAVKEFACLQGGETVYDLYAGAGTISICLASQAGRVVGFEIFEDALRDARVNCELNDVTNCIFVPGDLKDSLASDQGGDWGDPDIFIIDPPRAGMHEQVVRQVCRRGPARIVYVSCNPTTLARDARALHRANYELQQVQPVDMFPMTPHIELVSLLARH